MKKKVLAVLLSFCMAVGVLVAPVSASAAEQSLITAQQESDTCSFPTGRLTGDAIELDYDALGDEILHDSAEFDEQTSVYQLRSSAVYTSEWDKYKTWYFYNQLTADEQEYYDVLNTMCEKLLRTTKDVELRRSAYGSYYSTDFVTSSRLTQEQMEKILMIFRFSNPQYYFLDSAWLRASNEVCTYYALCVYSAFADGNKRMTATAAVKAQADIWEAQASLLSSEADRARLLHDLIIDKVSYNTDIYSSGFDENQAYTQSAYSVFCMDQTVCAGYSQAYAMMCNAVGVDTVAVTSTEHEWNKVRINDSWYNVDLTWADERAERYQFFWRSDSYYDTETLGSSYIYHKEESLWEGLLPPCTIDTVQAEGYTVPGTLPTVTQTAAVPTLKVTMSGNTYKITLSTSTPGAVIYYTLDGSLPSPAFTKSYRYTGTIKTSTVPTLRFMAVCDGMWDSEDKKAAIVTYKGNKSTSGSMKPMVISVGDTTTILDNAYKKSGNTFYGWNTKADGTGTSYAVGQTVTLSGNLNLYAQWYTGKYRIAYVLNGGSNSSKNPTGYTPGKKITLKNPTKKGYTFVGWYTNKKLTKKFTQITSKTKGTLTLYAKWQPVKYRITYQLNGGKNSSKNPKTYTITAKTIKLKNPTRKGYKFVGWYSNKKCTKKVTQITKGSTGNMTLYAKWKKA